MSTTAQDVWDLLPAGNRVGDIEVLGVEVSGDVDSEGDDAVRVVLVLGEPDGDTWQTRDAQELRALIRRGRVQAGEERSILFSLRSRHDEEPLPESATTGPGPVPHPGP